MSDFAKSVHDKLKYNEEQKEFFRWRSKQLQELGLIPDPYNCSYSNSDKVQENMILELTDLEYKAREYIDNYTEVPDEIKNRIFELRKILGITKG